MEKNYYKMQTLHNRFIRGTVTSICKIFLWTVAYGAVAGMIGSIATNISTSNYNSSISSYSSSSKAGNWDDVEMPLIIGGVLILLVSAVYWFIVGGEVWGKIKTHKELVEMENELLGLKDVTEKPASYGSKDSKRVKMDNVNDLNKSSDSFGFSESSDLSDSEDDMI